MELFVVFRDSVLGIATLYGLYGPLIESSCGRGFSHLKSTNAPVKWVPGLFYWRVKWPRCGVDHLPHLAPK